MRILVVNDDGWDAPGLAALVGVASEFGEVLSVAPLEKRSGCGHQVTFHRPLHWEMRGPRAWSLDGMPADCVRLGLSRFGPFDWVLAGINEGANLGVDVFLSGTVAAAREAAFHGLPSLAISQYRNGRREVQDWERSASMGRTVLSRLLSRPPGPGRLWNINLPDCSGTPGAEPAWSECELDCSPLPMEYDHEDLQSSYTGCYQQRKRIAGRDIDRCFSGSVTVCLL